MFKKLISSKVPIKFCAAIVCSTVVYKKITHTPEHLAAGYNYSRRFYPAASEYPDLTKNKNIMARNLTKNMYAKMRDLRTSNGFTIDDVIQPGIILNHEK